MTIFSHHSIRRMRKVPRVGAENACDKAQERTRGGKLTTSATSDLEVTTRLLRGEADSTAPSVLHGLLR